MAANQNLVLQLLITAKDQAAGVLSSLKTQLAGLAAAIGAAFSIKEAATFEKALDAVRARADETGPALEKLISDVKEVAQTLGPEFGYSATEAVLGIKELIAAGFTATESMDALKGTLALAAMEEIKVADAAILISDAIAQFGLTAADATDVANILAASAGAVAATAVDMAEALKYTGNAASSAGLSLTETSAVLDVLAKAGQRGSEAGTGLNSVLSILANPTHAATEALFALGATGTELGETLDLLERQGLNAAQTIALFGEQGARVINTLIAQGGSAAIADFADQIGNTGKSAEDTAKIMQQNLLGAFDRFWESLKRVGTELATPKLEPFAKGLDTLTTALNTFASNAKIQAFQQALADGFSAIYTAARDFANQIDWAGVSAVMGGAFEEIRKAVDSALTSLQSIYASLTGTLPGAASIAQQASDGLKAAWEGLGSVAQAAAGGIERIAQALSGPVSVGSDLARQALAALSGETDAARQAHDTLNAALKAGKITQEQVTAAWERMQTVMREAQGEIDAAQVAYQAVVAAQQAGTATQDQVNQAWQTLQTVIGAAQGKMDSAKLTYEGLNLQFTTGKGLTEAVAVAYDRVNAAIESARKSAERITQTITGQTTGFQTLWGVLQSEAPAALQATWDSLTTAAGKLLAGINALAQQGATFIAGFIQNADLSPVRDLFNTVADAAGRLAKTIADSFPQAQTAGQNFADAFTIAWSGVVGILAAVVSGTLKVVESIGRATFEVGKYFDRYSQEEIAKIEANLNGMSETAGEFAAVAARSFDASGKAMDRMRENSAKAEEQQKLLKAAGEGSAEAQQKLAAAATAQANAQSDAEAKARALALALALQKAEVERLSAADLSSETAKNAHAAATQKLWGLQGQFAETITGLTEEQYKNVTSTEAVKGAIGDYVTQMNVAGASHAAYDISLAQTTPNLAKLRDNMETTRAKFEAVNKAFADNTLKATENKSVTEQLNEAKKDAEGALGAYVAMLRVNVEAEALAIKTAQSKREAMEAVTRSGEALMTASIKLAELEGNEAKVAQLVAEQKAGQAEAAKRVAEEYGKEADAAEKSAEALKLKYEAMRDGKLASAQDIQQAKEAAEASNAEARAKRAAAIEAGAKIPVMEKEAEIAARSAGPVGDLIRLYEKKAAATSRESDAIERSYSGKIRDLNVEKDQAEAKGDLVRAAELAVEIKQAEAEKAQALADAMRVELEAQIALIEAKKLAMTTEEQATEAGKEKLAQMAAQIAKMRDLIDAEQDKADSAKADADATEKAAESTKKAGNEAEKTTEKVEKMSVAYAKFQGLQATAFGADHIRRYNMIVDSIEMAINRANDAAQELSEKGFNGINASAYNAARSAESMALALEDSQSYLNDAARAAADNLRTALADARQEAEGLAKSLLDMADDFERSMLQIKGDKKKLLELEYQDTLDDMEEIAKRAGTIASEEYLRAKGRAAELHKMKLQQLKDEEKAAQSQNTTSTTNSNNTGSTNKSSGGGVTLNINATGGIMDNNFADALARQLKPKLDEIARRSL